VPLTLVSHYGPKSAGFASLIIGCQRLLADDLGAGFRPYHVEQVHGTVVGLERASSSQLDHVIRFLSTDFQPFLIHVGGFRADATYSFTSRGRHPFERSFSIQGTAAVAMGWPRDNALDALRRILHDRFGVRHAYYKSPGDIDNDFYFVLGRIDASSLDPGRIAAAADGVRLLLSSVVGLEVPVSRETLSVVAYEDPELPLEGSRAFPVSAGTPPQL